eukprot:TRINITY_DN14736_c0_g1_i8.p1 TRINITY_DN14736_c0_g1~~TRINITY_DN14736_c0_g1_i8.p1  ORF type:complete len:109 (+),score=18.37 TRINITY_DN14736_c0_g1_i8:271-597(+)
MKPFGRLNMMNVTPKISVGTQHVLGYNPLIELLIGDNLHVLNRRLPQSEPLLVSILGDLGCSVVPLSLIHISEPTRLLSISYAVFCLKKKKKTYYQINYINYRILNKI